MANKTAAPKKGRQKGRRLFRRSEAGFSLLEIMIVTTIMAVIATMASRSIRTAVQNKKRIDARLKTETVVFDSLRLIATDVEKAFHYQYPLYELERQSLAQQSAQDQTQQQGAVNGAALKAPIRVTQFIGKEKYMHFTSLNNRRTTANSRESDQIEVGYYLENCKSRTTGKDSQCLWRRTSTILDNDVSRGGEATPLLENVTEFGLEYLSEDPNVKEWRKEWLTDNNGDTYTQNLFPLMVRVTLEVWDKDNKDYGKFKQIIVAVVRFTNNNDPAKRFPMTAPSQNGQQPGQQPGLGGQPGAGGSGPGTPPKGF